MYKRQFFTRCHQALVADGLLAFSTFGATNMHEIRQLTGHGLDYLSIEELQALLSPGFDILHTEEEDVYKRQGWLCNPTRKRYTKLPTR